jgi:glutamate synthase (NADPH/NADH) small chain
LSTTPDAALRREAFAEIHPPFGGDEARSQAARCLFCYDAPCTRACPTHIDIPRFIRQILHHNPCGAAETILDANVLGGSCARVCPTEVLCEGACVDRVLHDEAVPIGRLQRFAVDWADERGLSFFSPGPNSDRRVAIIGAGPAGLSCAFELRRAGHGVTVFEADDRPGGINTAGIAAYKISTEYALSEVERVRRMGAEIRLDTPVDGGDIVRLLSEYDAVFLGVGLGHTASLNIPGEDLDQVWEALDFIYQTHRKPLEECEVGSRVVVIGGGNTAIDAANAAARLGAEHVTVAYRRRADDMPAYEHEVALAKASGVAFEWLVAPVAIEERNGAVSGLVLQRLEMRGAGRSAELAPVAGAELRLDCDMVIKALGQQPLHDLLSAVEGLEIADGKVVVDSASGATSVAGLFAGGDCISNGAEVVDAVEQGKIASRGVSDLLAGNEKG